MDYRREYFILLQEHMIMKKYFQTLVGDYAEIFLKSKRKK